MSVVNRMSKYGNKTPIAINRGEGNTYLTEDLGDPESSGSGILGEKGRVLRQEASDKAYNSEFRGFEYPINVPPIPDKGVDEQYIDDLANTILKDYITYKSGKNRGKTIDISDGKKQDYDSVKRSKINPKYVDLFKLMTESVGTGHKANYRFTSESGAAYNFPIKYRRDDGSYLTELAIEGSLTYPTIKSDAKNIASILANMKTHEKSIEDVAKRTWGPGYKDEEGYLQWMKSENEKFKDLTLKEQINTIMPEGKTFKDIPMGEPAKNLYVTGRENKNFFETILNAGKAVLETAANAVVVAVSPITDPIVAAGEFVDDVFDGDNVGDALVGATLKATQGDHIVDAVNNISDGNYTEAVGDLATASGSVNSGIGSTGDINDVSVTDPAITAAGVQVATGTETVDIDPIVDPIIDAIANPDVPEPEMPSEINMNPIEKTTMKELKTLLGLGQDVADKKAIEELIGTEARQLSADSDITRMRQLYGDVAETGYDAGERETLSAKARRELAGLARQQGMAAGAAAGGLRGASVGAQARSLAEKAMQKQADVTTEMDKAAISRKDAARKDLATLAQAVEKFDIEKEQERKKRKGATTIGVQSLLQGEEIAKQQFELAKQDPAK